MVGGSIPLWATVWWVSVRQVGKGCVSIGWCTDKLGVPLGLLDGGRSTSLVMSLWKNDQSLVIVT